MPVTHAIPQLSLARQLETLRPEIEAAFARILDDTAFIGGPGVERFEADFARFCEADFCIGVGNGTDALYAIFQALFQTFGLKPGDEVIAPALTFIATISPLTRLGLKPVLADIDPSTYTLDPAAVERAITPRTRALLPVHLYGQPAEMAALKTLAKRRDLSLIEDAAQAHGARYGGVRAGALGDAAAFSFYPGKNLGAFGDGGAVTTSNPDLAENIRRFCDHGRLSKYEHAVPGVNSRLDALQAAVLALKLPHLDAWNQRRAAWAALYTDALSDVPELALPVTSPDRTHVYHQYVIRTGQRDALAAFLEDRGIATGLHYPLPLHLQPAYRDLGHRQGDFPEAEQLAETCLSLPLFAELREEEVTAVITAIRQFFGRS